MKRLSLFWNIMGVASSATVLLLVSNAAYKLITSDFQNYESPSMILMMAFFIVLGRIDYYRNQNQNISSKEDNISKFRNE